MNRVPIVTLFVLVIASLVVGACAPAATPAPTQPPAPVETEVPPTPMPELTDIVDTAVADGGFTTLVAAVQAAGLVETLKGEGPFTVFAPTDEAFAKLPEGTVEELLKPENLETLQNILLYHVVPGKVMAADVTALESAETASGQMVAIKADMGNVIFLGQFISGNRNLYFRWRQRTQRLCVAFLLCPNSSCLCRNQPPFPHAI